MKKIIISVLLCIAILLCTGCAKSSKGTGKVTEQSGTDSSVSGTADSEDGTEEQTEESGEEEKDSEDEADSGEQDRSKDNSETEKGTTAATTKSTETTKAQTTTTTKAQTTTTTTKSATTTTTKAPQETGILSGFTAKDLSGNTVTEAVLAGKKVTMINFWAPWCGPCVNEMPTLQALNEKYASQGFQVIGVIDVRDAANAPSVVSQTGVKYRTLIMEDPSSVIYNAVRNHPEYMGGIPFSFFVDQDGNQIGQAYTGAWNWEPIIQSLLG